MIDSLAERALAFVGDAKVVGLGTGRAAQRFVKALAAAKPDVVCVATSDATSVLAASLGLHVVPLQKMDVVFDGADEVDPALNMIKGYGGALLREKIVARAATRVVILVGEEKLVKQLGARGRLPIEVVPFAVPLVSQALTLYTPVVRMAGDGAFFTDNGNHILDCTPRVPFTQSFDDECRAIPGVMATGGFFNIATTVLVERPSGVEQLTRR